MGVNNKRVGLLGATSLVGKRLLPLMTQSGWRVVAFSRQQISNSAEGIEWRQFNSVYTSPLDSASELHSSSSISVAVPEGEEIISDWICVAPIWVLPDHFDLLKLYRVKRVVVISSTSGITKVDSSDPAEQAVAKRLIGGEVALQKWAEKNEIDWCIVRPTMIYGYGKDKNVAEIARLIRRWGFYPLLGKGFGLRQPLHVDDVAKACKAALDNTESNNRVYNLSGGETLSYKEMVKKIFIALDKKPRFVYLPRWCFRLALLGLHLLPRFKNWSVAMADRMNRDLVFDHKDATTELGFSPRSFLLESRDLP